MIGSNYYTSQLSEAEVAKIKFYYNYDTIASIQPEYWVRRTHYATATIYSLVPC